MISCHEFHYDQSQKVSSWMIDIRTYILLLILLLVCDFTCISLEIICFKKLNMLCGLVSVDKFFMAKFGI